MNMKEPLVTEIHDIRRKLLHDHHDDPLLYIKSAMKRQQDRHPRFASAEHRIQKIEIVSETSKPYSPTSSLRKKI